jgi:hypothetical protein
MSLPVVILVTFLLCFSVTWSVLSLIDRYRFSRSIRRYRFLWTITSRPDPETFLRLAQLAQYEEADRIAAASQGNDGRQCTYPGRAMPTATPNH